MRLALAPDVGGSILSLTYDGANLLRPSVESAADALDTGCFPLVPYANRVPHGRVDFRGVQASLRRNAPGQLHPLHGDGWRGAWAIEAAEAAHAVLTFSPDATDWPWPYRARQTFRLDPQGLKVELSVTNVGDRPAPVGLGFHPYFPNAGQARLTAQTDGVWMIDAEILPVSWASGHPVADWRSGAPLRTESLIDHCFTGWDAEARIDLAPGGPAVRMTASPECRFLHVYSPPDQDLFCVEPVSHRPDALHASDPESEGIRTLAPGESFAIWMRLEALA
jgi:aldose 1-epimerase